MPSQRPAEPGEVSEGRLLRDAGDAGPGPGDATCLPPPLRTPERGTSSRVEGLRIGIVPELLGEGVDPEVLDCVNAAAKAFEEQGARIVEVTMPHLKYGVASYYVVSSAEASSNLARYDGARYGRRASEASELEELYTKSRSSGFGDEVKRRIMIGTFTLSAGLDSTTGFADVSGPHRFVDNATGEVRVRVDTTARTSQAPNGYRLELDTLRLEIMP